MTRPTNEPAWCRHNLGGPHTDHVSRLYRVGKQQDQGEAAVWLEQEAGKPATVGLLAAQMASCAIELSLNDARQLYDHLGALLQAAAKHQPAQNMP